MCAELKQWVKGHSLWAAYVWVESAVLGKDNTGRCQCRTEQAVDIGRVLVAMDDIYGLVFDEFSYS